MVVHLLLLKCSMTYVKSSELKELFSSSRYLVASYHHWTNALGGTFGLVNLH